jgi:hypothetical protein
MKCLDCIEIKLIARTGHHNLLTKIQECKVELSF